VLYPSAVLLVALAVCSLPVSAGRVDAQPTGTPQSANTDYQQAEFDPLKSVTNGFPGSVTLKAKGHLLEFCPDNTCDGFVSASNVPVAELKDFAFLYIYFFSDYVLLPDWRNHVDASTAAGHVLSKPKYQNCQSENNREAARCVLLDLCRDSRIKLIFVRYDEHRRNVVPEDISKELSRRP
jgi:hypothetical protein